MEQPKKKRGDDARLGVKRVKRTDRDQTVKEEEEKEVEEFFAILRRIRVAVEYFDGKGGRDSTEKRWRPSFRREDFEAIDGGSKGEKRERSLDLNSVPPSCKETV